MDARQLLALQDTAPKSLLTAADVAQRKVAAYNGIPRRSKHERERDAAAKKQAEEDEFAAVAYEEYVAAFGVEEEGKSGRNSGKGFVRAGGGGYDPLRDRQASGSVQRVTVVPPVAPRAVVGRQSAASLMSAAADAEPIRSSLAPGKKQKDGDNFLEQLKRDQKEREDRLRHQAGRSGTSITALAAREHAPVSTGSFDTGDTLTTNIHVAGLPNSVTEQSIGMYFAQYGAVGSVKIMWPRAESAPAPSRILGGFVAYLRRPDAVRAMKEIDGVEWCGNVLRTSWGKSVPVPLRAIYEVEGGSNRRQDRHTSGRRSHSHDRSRSPDVRRRRHTPSRSPSPTSRIRRVWPVITDEEEEKFLRTVAAKVGEHGGNFERVIRAKERENPKFDFFHDESLPAFHFFKMLLDADYRPPLPPKALFSDEGNADVYSSDSAEDSERDHVKKGQLGRLATRRFESLLRSLTSTRDRIARGMAFALEHADSAAAVVEILVNSLTLPSTPVPRKIARLHLISDILHNSSASLPNAWVYRSIFERRLPEVFDHLGEVYRSFPGRMRAEGFKLLITNVVDVWERDWIVFEPTVIEDLKRRLSPPSLPTCSLDTASSQVGSIPGFRYIDSKAPGEEVKVREKEGRGFKVAAFAPSFISTTLPDREEVIEEEVDGRDLYGEDVDGEDVDGVDMEDVDGEEMGEDVDGEDLDGEVVEVVKPLQVVILEEDSDDDMF